MIEITDGRVTTVALSEDARGGVVVRSLLDDLESVRDGLTDAAAIAADDKFAQLARALWSQGVLVDVPADAVIDRPIVVRWAVGSPGHAMFTRTVVRVGDRAAATLVEEFVAGPGTDAAAAQSHFAGTMEVTVGDGASLQVASLQELPENVVAFEHRAAKVGDGGSLQWALAQLGGRLVRSRVDNRLVGDRSSVEQVEIVFGSDEQLFDLTSFTTHIGKNTTGNLLSKAALLEKSRTYLKGLITIKRSANGTDSFLGEFGMNLSKAARSVAIPSLEIDQPDCRRAAHSSSVGPIDETQLFYLESRGSRPTRRASSSCWASSSRWLPGSRWRLPRTVSASSSRRNGSPAPTASPARPPPDASTTSVASAPGGRGRAMRRIDLIGTDEIGDGEMQMVWVDGTDQVLVINQSGEFTAVQGVCSHEYFELDKGF